MVYAGLGCAISRLRGHRPTAQAGRNIQHLARDGPAFCCPQKRSAQLHRRFQTHAQRQGQVIRVALAQRRDAWYDASVIDQGRAGKTGSRLTEQPRFELAADRSALCQVFSPLNQGRTLGYGKCGQRRIRMA